MGLQVFFEAGSEGPAPSWAWMVRMTSLGFCRGNTAFREHNFQGVVLDDGDPDSHWSLIRKGLFPPKGEGRTHQSLQGGRQYRQQEDVGHSS